MQLAVGYSCNLQSDIPPQVRRSYRLACNQPVSAGKSRVAGGAGLSGVGDRRWAVAVRSGLRESAGAGPPGGRALRAPGIVRHRRRGPVSARSSLSPGMGNGPGCRRPSQAEPEPGDPTSGDPTERRRIPHLPIAAPRTQIRSAAPSDEEVQSTVVEHVGARDNRRALSGDHGRGRRGSRGANKDRSGHAERQDGGNDEGSPDAHDSSIQRIPRSAAGVALTAAPRRLEELSPSINISMRNGSH